MARKKASSVKAKSGTSLTTKIALRLTSEPIAKIWKSLTANTNQGLVDQINTLRASASKTTNPHAKHAWNNAARTLEGILAAEQKPTRDAFVGALLASCAALGIPLVKKADGGSVAAPVVAAKRGPKPKAKPAAKAAKAAKPAKGKLKSSYVPKTDAADPETAKKIVAYLKAQKTSDKSNGITPRKIFADLKIEGANLSKTFKNSKEVGMFGHAGGKVYFYKGA